MTNERSMQNVFTFPQNNVTSGSDLKEVNAKLQTVVNGAERWFTGNKLVVNRPKSNTVLVSNTRRTSSLNIEFKGENLTQSF